MKFTEKEIKELKESPLMDMFSKVFGINTDELFEETESETNYKKETTSDLDKRVAYWKDQANTTKDVDYKCFSEKEWNSSVAAKSNEASGRRSFSMSKEDLNKFVESYTKLENTFRKLEHTFGIDFNANADSIYSQYNTIVWNLIENIFGEDNREDIANFCFGDSNLETVDDLYEELV